MASALGIEWASGRGRIREDSAIGIVWSVGMAVGALFMSLRPGYTSGDMAAYLFGSLVTVSRSDVAELALLTGALLLGAALWLRPVMFVAFDREFARSRGLAVRTISYVLAALTALTIVLSIRIMANTLSRDYRAIARTAPCVAVAANVAGLLVSYRFDVPPGAAIIFVLTLWLVAVKLLTLHGKKSLTDA